MTKILKATAQARVVTFEGQSVAAEILSEGVGSSEGLLIIERDKAFYIPSSALDIKSTLESLSGSLEQVSNALTQIATSLTSIGANMTGPTTSPPPTLAADVLLIQQASTAIMAIKTQADTLSENLK